MASFFIMYIKVSELEELIPISPIGHPEDHPDKEEEEGD
tara:strand:- start:4123 stop:4239 length:117 start_codon:yes stop_codon:yes gene_type:complete